MAMAVKGNHDANNMLSALGSDNDGFQRLLQLKQQYGSYKQQLEKLDGKRKGEQPHRPHSRLVYKALRREPMDSEQLHVVVKQIMEQHGGGCHLDTLTEYVVKRWPTAVKRDGEAFTVHDFKAAVLRMLKSKASIYSGTNAGAWTLTRQYRSSIDNATTVKTLASAIGAAIKKQNGAASLPTITEHIKENWVVPIIKGKELEEVQVNEAIVATLETNPRFQYDPVDPDLFLITPKKKRNRRFFEFIEEEEAIAPAPKRQRASPTTKVYQVQSRNGDEVEAPPPGYACPCGATAPGRSPVAKWRLDDDNEWKCITCYELGKRAGSSLDAKRDSEERDSRTGRNSRSSNRKSAARKEVAEEPWIQCDRCHAWVPTSEDGITDLSVYDDSNPNHLDYFCPKCREKSSQEDSRGARNRRRNRH